MDNFGKVEQKREDYQNRFSGVIGSEYNLFEKSVPWHEEFQNTIGDKISDYCFQLKDKEKISVLEAGCGTGLTTIRILNADKRIRVLALDNEDQTLNQAREILHDFEDRINFIKKDVIEYLKNIDDNSLDIFASAYLIHNLPATYREKIFREIFRTLKSGGLFINGDKYAKDDEAQHERDLREQIKDFDVYEKMNRSDIKEEWTRHYYDDEKIKITEGEQKKILQSLGFCEVETVFRKRMEAIITAVK
ncbi:class I SAM-dependent methyltransferase [Candidatus Parcubacteria bacterium]|nr:class I SAM-dependent methyltransferase [Candidatus Parcubacteria bacterium]